MPRIVVYYVITGANGRGYTPRIKLSLAPTMGSSLENHMKSHIENVIASTGQKCEVEVIGHDALEIKGEGESLCVIKEAISDIPNTAEDQRPDYTIKGAPLITHYGIRDAPFIKDFCEVAEL